MVDLLLVVAVVLLLVNLWLTLQWRRAGSSMAARALKEGFAEMDKMIVRLEALNREEFARNRDETAKSFREHREEISGSFKALSDSILSRMAEIAGMLKDQLEAFAARANRDTQMNREELTRALKSFEERFAASVRDFNDLQKEKFAELVHKQNELIQTTEQKLEKMRATVDEKLHKTLEERLGDSFKLVSERLELVHKGLGEMQTLATGVGDLKKVLSNVKTRGILGEIQLENILEQILTPEQYAKNIATKPGARETVEFAIKLPGRSDGDDTVFMPLDSKFPLEVYHNLLEAYDTGEQKAIDEAGKYLELCIKKAARDIRDKYIEPPATTDFGIMFLPIEGLYAEVVRRNGLLEQLQREYRINITGPTTLAALLNSLQMGFKTLAIEKRSSEVWKILGAIKTEFEKFGVVLNKAQDKINQASNELDMLVGTRTRQIQRRLKNIQSLPADEALRYIAAGAADTDSDED